MLIDAWRTKCVLLNKVKTSDGMGGYTTSWVDGAQFDAAIVKDSTADNVLAEKEGVTETFTVTVDRNLGLEFHDVFRRNEDGAIFRVTSNATDSKTPSVSTFSFGQVTAERWVLS